jgi:predicted O-linked N-acetylglucosamine transferase (SPINDLY family)
LSVLSNVGLSELVARTPGQYIETAVALAQDRRRMSALRAELRQRLLASPLADAGGFAADVETALRRMWQRWCCG